MPVPQSQTIDYDNVNTLTESRYLPGMIDNIFKSNALLMRLYDKGTKLDGGTFIKQVLIYGEGPGGFYDGRSGMNVSEAEQFSPAIFRYKYGYAAARIARSDELQNSGEAQFKSLLQAKYKVMQKTMKNILGMGVHSDASDPLSIVGLQLAVAGSGTVYGQISGTTWDFWRSPIKDMAATPTTDALIQEWLGNATEDNDSPDLLCGRQSQYNIFYNVVEPQKRITDPDMGRLGFKSILVHGLPFVVDSHAAENTTFGLNTNYLNLVTHQDENMRFLGWDHWFSPVSREAFICWAGNLTCSNRRFQTKMINHTQ